MTNPSQPRSTPQPPDPSGYPGAGGPLDRGGPAGREPGLDIARGLAVIGMVLVNFDLALGSGAGPRWLGFLVESLQGRASALFVVLAGVGIHLLARSRGSSVTGTLARRGLVLAAGGFGLLLLWPADILHFYGVWFLLAIPFVKLSPLPLAGLATGVTLLFPTLLLLGVDYERHWDFSTLEYGEVFTGDGLVRHLFFNGFHPTLPWFAFLLAGMAVAPRLLDRTRSPLPLAWTFGAIAVAVELLADAAVKGMDPELATLLDTASMPPGPPYILAAGATAIAVLCVAVAWGRGPAESKGPIPRFAAAALGATGKIALSLYVLHVLTGVLPPYVAHEASGGPHWERPTIVIWWGAWTGAAVGFAGFLHGRGMTGPLERVFRWLGGGRATSAGRT